METCDNTVRRAAQPLVSGEDLGHTSTSPLPASLSNKSYFDNMTAGWCWGWVVMVGAPLSTGSLYPKFRGQSSGIIQKLYETKTNTNTG